MADSAYLKIDRAAKHIEELSELVHQTRPFGNIIGTNTETGQRLAFPTKNEAVIRCHGVDRWRRGPQSPFRARPRLLAHRLWDRTGAVFLDVSEVIDRPPRRKR
jgi:hypothetical protein